MAANDATVLIKVSELSALQAELKYYKEKFDRLTESYVVDALVAAGRVRNAYENDQPAIVNPHYDKWSGVYDDCIQIEGLFDFDEFIESLRK